MAPNPVRRLLYSTSKTCLKVLKKLATPGSRRRCHPQAAGPGIPEPVTCLEHPDYSGSCVTVNTWLDDVRDLEDMDNRLNEALEIKMAADR